MKRLNRRPRKPRVKYPKSTEETVNQLAEILDGLAPPEPEEDVPKVKAPTC